jgi:bacteriophage N4 adsorption protein B
VNSADLVALGLLALQVGFVLIMVVYLIAGLDDLIIDLMFFVVAATRWLGRGSGHCQPTLEEMTAKPEQPFALMFPAWHEADVIRRALMNTIGSIDYRNFHVFVGTYVNDPDTQREVSEIIRHHRNVTQIVVPHPGPTCKADCLNWVVKGIREHQEQHGVRFAGIVLHDAEDLVDPLSLKLFNCMMPQYDLVQIPIISLKRSWWDLIGGHYMDEFAEAHCKEIHVREWFAGIVPGAGVGTGYSLRAIEAAAAASGGDAFATDSLTEDYEFSFRVRELGLKQAFVQVPIVRRVPRRSLLRREPRLVSRRDFVTTREYFPDLFWASVRQKTRWVIGIQLQGWKKFGWRGDWRTRYLYFRDRKSLATQQFMVLGYIVALGLIGVEASSALFPERFIFAPPLADNSPLWYLFDINVGLLANRLVHRHIWTCRIYGWSQLPLIVPRYIVSNIVNYLAVTRATLRYLKHLRTGERIGWDKTAHSFPGEELLAAYRRKLGDVLIEHGLVTPEQVQQGMAAQASSGRLLGAALVDIGVLDENALIDVLCAQLRLPRARAVHPYEVSLDLLRLLPERWAKALSVFPIEEIAGGRIALACAVVPDTSGIRSLEEILGTSLEFRLASRGEVAFALRHGYARLELADRGEVGSLQVVWCPVGYRPIGEQLIDIGAIDYRDLIKGLSEAAQCGKRVGEYLLDGGRIRQEHVAEAMARQEIGERQPSSAIAAASGATQGELAWALPQEGRVVGAG